MKGLLGIAMALVLTAVAHAALSHYWRPLLPWKTNVLDAASWWHSPVSWLAMGLLIVGAVALLVLGLWAVSESDATTGRGFGVSLGVVALPYTASVLLYVLVSGPPIRVAADGLPATGATTGLAAAARETSPGLRSGSPAIELKVSSVADAEAGLSRVRDHLRSTLTPASARLTSDVDDIKARLKSSGVSGSADLKDNARGRVLAQELAEAIRYRNAVATSIEVHKNAEFELDSLLRRLKRAELVASAGLPEGDLLRMNATLRLLDGQLAERAGQPKELSTTELDALIDKELAPRAANDAEMPSTVAATHR